MDKKTRFTGNVGKKFNEDGSAKRFPGNTIICHIPNQSPQFDFLMKIRGELMRQSWIKKYSLLPPSSFHMTVIEGICDSVRKPSHWPTKLALDASLKEADEFFIQQFNEIIPPQSFQTTGTYLFIGNTIGMRIVPVSVEMKDLMRKYRDHVAEKLGLWFPGHDFYQFHVSFAYLIERLSFKERIQTLRFMKRIRKEIKSNFGILTLNTPELTFFENMTNFAPSRNSSNQNIKE